MANLVDDTGSVNSNLVSGRGTNSATFPMPGNVALQVESVVATVDNTAGATTGATLVVKDQSGVVIATRRQGDTIPAGGTGTMTWALRLAGESSTAGTTGHAVYFGNPVTINSNSSALLTWDLLQAGDDLLDLTDPTQPTTREAGFYAVSVYVRGQMGAAGEGFFISLEMDTAGDDPQMSQDSDQSPNIVLAFVTTTLVYYSPAGGIVKLLADLGTTAGPRDITLWYGNVAKLS